jgi:DNA-binding NarL/FixJ family response regulator
VHPQGVIWVVSMPGYPRRGGGEPFVGRHDELAFLRAQLDQARGGAPTLVVIEGPAGIGKTALVSRFLAEEDEPVVFQASAAEDESILDYGVLSQLLRAAHAFTGQSAPLEPRSSLPRPDSHPNPLVAGSAVLAVLGELQRNGSGPVVIVVDDAHWADLPSLHALTFMFRRLLADRVLGILTVRDSADGRLPDGLRRLIARAETRRLMLEGLGAADLCTLSSAYGQQPLPVWAGRRLCEHTGGNPLHARALFEQVPFDALSDVTAPLPAPRSYALLVLARLARCGDGARRLVSAASVLGLSTSLHTAAKLAGVDDPLSALDEAVKAGLLQERHRAGRGPATEFPHPLIRAAVYQDLGPTRRTRLHEHAARVVDDDISALRHRLDAAIGPDPGLASELAASARRSLAAGSWAAGGALLSHAARLTATDAERARLSVEAIEALLFGGQIDHATALAADLPRSADPAVRGYAAGHLAAVTGRVHEAIELLTGAWDSGGHEARPWLAARIAEQLARLSARQGQGSQAAAWAARALAFSGAQPRSDLIRCVHLIGLGMSGALGEGLALTAALPDPAMASVAELDTLLGRGLLRTWADDLGAAVRDLRGVLAAGRDRSVPFRLLAAAALSQAEYRLGLWNDALLHAELADSIAREVSHTGLVPMSVMVTALVAAARGDWEVAAASVSDARDSAEHTGCLSGLVCAANADAYLAAARGDSKRVVTGLRSLLDLESGRAVLESGVAGWQDLLAEALAAGGELDAAEEVLVAYEARAASRGRHSVLANAGRARGILYLARRDGAAAEAAFRTGLEHAAQVSVPFDQARLELAYGAFLRRAGKRAAAAQHLQAAQAALRRLGARPYLNRCGSELAACGRTPSTTPQPRVSGLTPQEHAVARLASQGLTNGQIARRLVLSVKTIEYHLSHAYAKLNVTSRVALAAALGGDAQWSAVGR